MTEPAKGTYNNGIFRGATDATLAGIAKAMKLHAYTQWFLIAAMIGAVGWLYRQMVVVSGQVGALTEQVRALADTVGKMRGPL